MNRFRSNTLLSAVTLAGLLGAGTAVAQTPYAGTPVVSEMQGRRADVWAWARIPYYQNYFSLHHFDTPAYAHDDGFGLFGVDYPLFGYPPRHAIPQSQITVSPPPPRMPYSPGEYVSPGTTR